LPTELHGDTVTEMTFALEAVRFSAFTGFYRRDFMR
jgi:hypothetical protein